MLFSIALTPGVLQPAVVQDPVHLRAITHLLRAVAENVVIVSPDIPAFRSSLLQIAAIGSSAPAQVFQVLATDIGIRADQFVVCPPADATASARLAMGGSPCAACALWGRTDAIVIVDDAERQALLNRGISPSSLITLDDFEGSTFNQQRISWREAQRLDNKTPSDVAELVGRVLRYSAAITVADKMIGISAKDSTSGVRKYLQGIRYFAKTWKAKSPLSVSVAGLAVEIVTVAGSAGARAGFLDPARVRRNIATAMGELNRDGLVSRLDIILKQDAVPQIFNDRLLSCGGRVWGLHHGLDDFGKLGTSGRKRPTMLDPPSDARSTIFRDILNLRLV